MSKWNIKKCKACGSHSISWFPSLSTNTDVQDGRLKFNDILVDFYLGCDYCSETLAKASMMEILEKINE